MPHFVVDCSHGVLEIHNEESIIARLHRVASSSGLFEESDIKVRIRPFRIYAVGGGREDFIHTFAWIMRGRSVEQRAALSKAIVNELAEMFPLLPRIAANIADATPPSNANPSTHRLAPAVHGRAHPKHRPRPARRPLARRR